jgi:protein RecA
LHWHRGRSAKAGSEERRSISQRKTIASHPTRNRPTTTTPRTTTSDPEAVGPFTFCAFIDAEHALDVQYARGIGVDTERLLVSQPDTGEQALEIVEMLVRSGAIDLVVVDSVAALTPKAEGEMGDPLMGLQARLMSQALRKLTGVTHRTGTVIVFINQHRCNEPPRAFPMDQVGAC